MTATTAVTQGGPYSAADLSAQARRHLWMHFTRIGADPHAPVPIIVSGEGCYVYDADGKRYLDGLSALYCVNAGHGRPEFAQAAAAQLRELDFYTTWSYAHPRAIELAERIADARARRPQPRLLHLRGLGGGRVRDQARTRLPPPDRARPEDEDHRPRGRLPRDHDGGAGRHRRDRAPDRRSSR